MSVYTVDDIKAELAEIEERKRELEVAYAEKKQAARAGVIEQIKGFIADHGFDLSDILAELAPKQPEKKARVRRESAVSYPIYALISDPSKTYVRGKMPAWLVGAINAAGFDPATKEGREGFKAAHMRKEAA